MFCSARHNKTGIKLENQSFACSNPKCKRIFANPITVRNLSSENPVSYRACPYCLTEIVTEKTRIEKVKAETTGIEPAQQLSSETHKCPYNFGYLSQQSIEEIPEECMTCAKIVKCMFSEPKISKVVKQTGKIHDATEPSENQFKVENLGMLYKSWSKTVRVDRQTLSGWGEKIKEVEVETLDGKRTRCKVQPMEGSKKRIIQIPDKMQLDLEIEEGELVKVKPVIE